MQTDEVSWWGFVRIGAAGAALLLTVGNAVHATGRDLPVTRPPVVQGGGQAAPVPSSVDASAPVMVAKKNSGGKSGGGGGGLPNQGKGNQGPGNPSTAIEGDKELAGFASTRPFVFGSLEATTADGVKTMVLKGKVADKAAEIPLMSANIPYFNAAGDVVPLSRIKAGQAVEAVVFKVDKDMVVAFRDNKTVVIKQRKLKVASANSSTETVSFLEASSGGSITMPVEGAILTDAVGGSKRFSDIKVGSTVEVMWKDDPGKKALVLMKL